MSYTLSLKPQRYDPRKHATCHVCGLGLDTDPAVPALYVQDRPPGMKVKEYKRKLYACAEHDTCGQADGTRNLIGQVLYKRQERTVKGKFRFQTEQV